MQKYLLAIVIAVAAAPALQAKGVLEQVTHAVQQVLPPAALQNGAVRAVLPLGIPAGVVTNANLGSLVQQQANLVHTVGVPGAMTQLPDALRIGLHSKNSDKAQVLSQQITIPGQTPLQLRALINVGNGLVYSGSIRRYVGRIYVALVNVANTADQSKLANPVSVALTAIGADLNPSGSLKIDRLGDWQDVGVQVIEPELPYHMAASADPTEKGDNVDLSVLAPKVTLAAREGSIFGWGLGTTQILVKTDRVIDPQGLNIPLTVNGGELDGNGVIMDSQGFGVIKLRSGSGRVATVKPIGSPFESAQAATVDVASPFPFFALAGVGGLAGAFVREKGRKNSGRALEIGIVSALIMASAYAVGIDWVRGIIGQQAISGTGYALIAVLGAIAAITGITVLVPKTASRK